MLSMRAQLSRIRDLLIPRRICAKKKRYLSEHYAMRVMRVRQPYESVELHVYRCPECNGWHLTRLVQQA